jgi:predicted signal transduction protein with EAL and GGDEF domain
VARLTAIRVFQRVAGPCVIDGVTVPVAASVGVAIAPAHGREFDTLLRHADRAMYVAKASGCKVAIFDPQFDDECARTAARSAASAPIQLP